VTALVVGRIPAIAAFGSMFAMPYAEAGIAFSA
jgi:hypothetical protein